MTHTIKTITILPELQVLMEVFALAFESEYHTEGTYLMDMLENSSTILIGAYGYTDLIGGIVAFEIHPIHGKKEIYIYDIAVHPDYQKQGIGKHLIDYLKVEAKNRGIDTIFVEAESEDEGAVAFYRAIGGEEVRVNHFNFKI
jgi:aminoglycoside 3-N-acetyltransferase I